MSIRLVVFDLDGTLVDSSGDLAAGVNRALARLAPGTPALPCDQVRGFIGDGARMLIARVLAARATGLEVDTLLPIFMEEYRECLLDSTTPYPGVLAALDELAERQLAVLTNKPGDLSRSLLAGLGLQDRFFRILGGGDGPERKPDPAGLRELMQQAACEGTETVLVGDSAIDVRTGRAAGVTTVGVSWGFGVDGLREHPPDLFVDDPRQLTELIRSSGV